MMMPMATTKYENPPPEFKNPIPVDLRSYSWLDVSSWFGLARMTEFDHPDRDAARGTLKGASACEQALHSDAGQRRKILNKFGSHSEIPVNIGRLFTAFSLTAWVLPLSSSPCGAC